MDAFVQPKSLFCNHIIQVPQNISKLVIYILSLVYNIIVSFNSSRLNNYVDSSFNFFKDESKLQSILLLSSANGSQKNWHFSFYSVLGHRICPEMYGNASRQTIKYFIPSCPYYTPLNQQLPCDASLERIIVAGV